MQHDLFFDLRANFQNDLLTCNHSPFDASRQENTTLAKLIFAFLEPKGIAGKHIFVTTGIFGVFALSRLDKSFSLKG